MGSPDSDVRSITLRLLRDRRVTTGRWARRLMPDRIRPRAVLAAFACLAGVAGLGLSAGAAASASTVPSPSASASAVLGGSQLGSRGTVVSYPSRSAPRLPNVAASAFVVADAGTGQVLAAKDPHGWYRPASTLKMLTAVALIPVLNPDAAVVASKQATSVEPNVVGLV